MNTKYKKALLITAIIVAFAWLWTHWGGEMAIGTVQNAKLTFDLPSSIDEIAPDRLVKYVDVRKIDLNIDSRSQKFISSTLSMFFNTPHAKIFDRVSGENWSAKYKEYKTSIIERARNNNLDFITINRCFDQIEKENSKQLPLLPIAAYLAKNGKDDMWIIVCGWGWPGEGFGHKRAWAFKADSGKVIGFATCS